MAILDREIACYEELRADLEREYAGSWVLIHQEDLVGIYSAYAEADQAAADHCGREPCLVRQIGVQKPFAPPALARFQYAIQN